MKRLAWLVLIVACESQAPSPVWRWQGPLFTADSAQAQVFARLPEDSAHSITVWLVGDSVYAFRDEEQVAERFPQAELLLRNAIARREGKRIR
jgi:hypothetical protein